MPESEIDLLTEQTIELNASLATLDAAVAAFLDDLITRDQLDAVRTLCTSNMHPLDRLPRSDLFALLNDLDI